MYPSSLVTLKMIGLHHAPCHVMPRQMLYFIYKALCLNQDQRESQIEIMSVISQIEQVEQKDRLPGVVALFLFIFGAISYWWIHHWWKREVDGEEYQLYVILLDILRWSRPKQHALRLNRVLSASEKISIIKNRFSRKIISCANSNGRL